MGTDQQVGRQFLEELARHQEPALAVIREFVTSVAEGVCPLHRGMHGYKKGRLLRIA